MAIILSSSGLNKIFIVEFLSVYGNIFCWQITPMAKIVAGNPVFEWWSDSINLKNKPTKKLPTQPRCELNASAESILNYCTTRLDLS